MRLVRSLAIYTLSSALSGAVPLALLPILTRELNTEQYGIIATITTLIVFATPPLMWGIAGAISVEYYRRPHEQFCIYFSSILILPVVAFFLLSGLVILFSDSLATKLGIPVRWVESVPLLALLTLFPQLFSTILRMRQMPMKYAGFEFFTSTLTVALSLLFVLFLQWQWQGRLLAIAVTSAIGTIISLGWLYKQGYLILSFHQENIRDAFKFGAGVVPHDMSNNAIRAADRLILVAMVGLAGAGQYAVAMQIAGVMLIALSAFNRAWVPYLFSHLIDAQPETHKFIVKTSYTIIAAACVFFLAFNAAVPWAYQFLIDAKFYQSMEYVRWITLGYLFMAAYLTFVDYIFYVKKTHILSLITVLNITCNLTLNYFLVKNYGTIGAAYAFAITSFFVMILTFILSNRLYPMPWLFWIWTQEKR